VLAFSSRRKKARVKLQWQPEGVWVGRATS